MNILIIACCTGLITDLTSNSQRGHPSNIAQQRNRKAPRRVSAKTTHVPQTVQLWPDSAGFRPTALKTCCATLDG